MKTIYRRLLQRALDKHVPVQLPGFIAVSLKLSARDRSGATLFPGSCLYAKKVSKGTLFLHFIPHRRQESFLCEIGWSVSGRFPVELTSHGPITLPDNEFTTTDWLIDFGVLFHRKHHLGHAGWDVWQCSVGIDDPEFLKIFVEEDLAPVSEYDAEKRVTSAVAKALEDVSDVAPPYFEEWVRYRTSLADAT